MKKYSVLLIAMMFMAHVSSYAALEFIKFDYGIYDPTSVGPGTNRGPVLIPEVSIEGYTLFFDTPCDGCLLRIVNEDDDVEYSTIIPIGTTSLVLPSYLSGEYELQIISGNYVFYGDISL